MKLIKGGVYIKILSVQIKDYHSCKNTVVELDNHLTSLIGLNGCGKTSILRAILLLKEALRTRVNYKNSGESEDLSAEVLVKFDVDDKIVQMKAIVSYIYDDEAYEDVISSTTKWKIEELSNNKWLDIPIQALYYNKQMTLLESSNKKINIEALSTSWYRYTNLNEIIPTNVYEVLSQIVKTINGISYYSATHFSDPSKCPSFIEIEDNVPIRRNRSSNHQALIYDIYSLKNKDSSTYERFRSTINEEGIGLVADMNFEEIDVSSDIFNVRAGGNVSTRKKKRMLIIPKFAINDRILSPSQLSEGTFKTIALLFYIISSNSNILMIEEPEVCIHHGLLNSVIEIIKRESERKQIIISTHSDYILDQLEPSNVVFIINDKVNGTIAKKLTKNLKRSSFKALHEYLDNCGSLGEYWREGGFDNV